MTTAEFIREAMMTDQIRLRGVKVRLGFTLFFGLLAGAVPPLLGFKFLVFPLLSICATALVANLVALVWIARGRWLSFRIYFSTFMDFVLVTTAIHYLGGLQTPFSWIYAVVIIATATLHGMRVGIYSAALSFLMCSVLLIGEFSGTIPHIDYNRLNPVLLHEDSSYLLIILLSNFILFFSVSVVSGLLSKRLLRSKTTLKKTVEDRTKDLSAANEHLRHEIIERKFAEEELRKSKIRFEAILNAIPDVVYEVTLDGELVYVNESVSAVLGYPRDNLIGMPLADLLDEKGRETVNRIREDLLSGKTTRPEVYHIKTADGRIVLVESHVTLLRRDGQSPTCIAVTRDITGRKLAENALAESLSLVRATLESTPDGILVTDTKGNIADYNQNFLHMWSIPRQIMESADHFDVRAHILRQARHPDKFIRQTEELYDNPGRENLHVLELKDGRIIDRYSRPKIIGAKTAGIVMCFRDVTESRRAEQLLRKSEQKYRTLFEESRDVVYISTPEGRLLDVNQAGVKLLGYSSKNEILETNIADTYLNHDDREKLRRTIEQHGFAHNVELTLRSKDGQPVDVLVTANVVRNENGDIVAYRGIMRDITEQKCLQQQFIQAQKMEGLGTLAGGIAHDFNNLLAGILGFASLAKTKVQEHHPIFKYLDTIEKSAQRASELTAQLLAFARSGKYQVKPVNLNDIVAETVEIIGRTFDKSIRIETMLHGQLPAVEADAGQIQQVLLNLCINAKDAMSGGGKLTIDTGVEMVAEKYAKTHIDAEPGRYVTLSVSDTGVGIDKEILPKIFEPFFTTKEKGKGTGLGLSMVYGVVRNHGGFVNVYTELCVGTTFKVYLPASAKSGAEEATEMETPAGGSELILVADDEEPIRFLAKEILEGCGYRVLVAENGAQAVEIYRDKKHEIGLVVLDMVMPILGGRETFLKLREMNPAVKALLSTGYSQDYRTRQILDSGVSGFIQKPYQPNALLSKVRSILDTEIRA